MYNNQIFHSIYEYGLVDELKKIAQIRIRIPERGWNKDQSGQYWTRGSEIAKNRPTIRTTHNKERKRQEKVQLNQSLLHQQNNKI